MKSYLLKNYLTAFFLLTTAFSFTACEKDVLRGKGEVVSRTRTVGSYDAINMGGEFEVYLTQGPAKDIILEGQENVLAELMTTTRNNQLEIKYNKHNVKIDKPVKVYLTTPNLTEVNLSGSNTVRGLTDWQVNDLKLSSSGSGSINLTLINANNIQSKVSGSGEITLNGIANKHELDISGSGKLKAYSLTTKISDINISGSGKAELTVTEQLIAKISGSGDVYYKGSPGTVNTSISGSGSIHKAD